MEVIAAVDSKNKIQPDQPVSTETKKEETTTTTSSTATASAETSTFETFLKAKLGGNAAGSISEEALFASLVEQRISTLKGEETATKYASALDASKASLARSDGFIPLEDAAKTALSSLRAAGDLTAEDADKIYTEAFAGAQLDANTSALFDDRGGAGDTTIATADFTTALGASKGIIDKITSGELSLTLRSLDEAAVGKSAATSTSGLTLTGLTSGTGETITPTGTTFDGQNGFLFKPISENQQTLAVLLPEVYKGMVSGVVVRDAMGNVLDSGTSTGYGEEGTREKFSFSKKGGDYGQNLTVGIQFMDGTNVDYSIPDGSQRYD